MAIPKQRRRSRSISLATTFGLVFLSFSSFGSVAADVEDVRRATSRRLLIVPEAKKEALNGLEDVLLEPPRESAKRSNSKTYLRETKYLPDLTGDTLDGYPRRVFLDVGPDRGEGVGGWFERHYPTRNWIFEMIRVETKEEAEGCEMSEWLERNVGEEDYVVMKAEAEVVEEMVRSGAIGLVDELFLECRWEKGDVYEEGVEFRRKRRKRAYWECLALYGKLRDEGVAVHQWWG